jgi:DNA processing protein
VVSQAQAEALAQVPPKLAALADQTWEWLSAAPGNRRMVTLGDAGYPSSLLETSDPPLLLYVMGPREFDLTQLSRSLAIVGSRNPTPQGASNARSFAQALGEAGVAVVSGLALGIDGAAHEGALQAAGNDHRLATVAVVGTGLDRVYPARHRDLAHRIAQQGLLVSEFPLGTPPLAQNFPMRNRIIAGLSRGALVVEAALQSGSLITARLAVEQGKDVFAIPGSIHAPQSRGCHALIRQGAKLVENVQDIFEDLDLRTAAASAPADIAAPAAQDEPPLLAALGHDPVSLDALVARTGWPAAQLQAQLLELELGAASRACPAGCFSASPRAEPQAPEGRKKAWGGPALP